MEEDRITNAHSRIITPNVVRVAKDAGGQEHGQCVVCQPADQPCTALTNLGLLSVSKPGLVSPPGTCPAVGL